MRVGAKYRCNSIPSNYISFYLIGETHSILEIKDNDILQTTSSCKCNNCRNGGISIPLNEFKIHFTQLTPDTLSNFLIDYVKGRMNAHEINERLEYLT